MDFGQWGVHKSLGDQHRDAGKQHKQKQQKHAGNHDAQPAQLAFVNKRNQNKHQSSRQRNNRRTDYDPGAGKITNKLVQPEKIPLRLRTKRCGKIDLAADGRWVQQGEGDDQLDNQKDHQKDFNEVIGVKVLLPTHVTSPLLRPAVLPNGNVPTTTDT